jgi:hypothetical protein
MTIPPVNAIDVALDQLFALHWLDGLAAQLSTLHREHGQPVAPDPTFGRTPMQLPFLPFAKVGELGGHEALAVDAYNSGVKAAYLCIDCTYVGLMTGLANESKKPEAWARFSKAARQTIEGYFSRTGAFEDFDAYILAPARSQLGL